MTSTGPTVVAPPVIVETLPRWLTLGEAAFISGVEEEALQAWVTAGSIRCDRSLSRRLGDHYLLVLSDDLVAAGLLRRSSDPLEGEESDLAPEPTPAPKPAAAPIPAAPLAPHPVHPPIPVTAANGAVAPAPVAAPRPAAAAPAVVATP